MAEIRKHNPDDDGDVLGKLVRDALGQNVRPTEQGQPLASEDEKAEEQATGSSAFSMTDWSFDGPDFPYTSGTLGSNHDS